MDPALLLQDSVSNVNQAADLVQALKRESAEGSLSAHRGLQLYFEDLAARGVLGGGSSGAGQAAPAACAFEQYNAALFQDYTAALLEALATGEVHVKAQALVALMSAQGLLPALQPKPLAQLVTVLLAPGSEDTRASFGELYLPHPDVRLVVLRALKRWADGVRAGQQKGLQAPPEPELRAAFSLLQSIPAPPDAQSGEAAGPLCSGHRPPDGARPASSSREGAHEPGGGAAAAGGKGRKRGRGGGPEGAPPAKAVKRPRRGSEAEWQSVPRQRRVWSEAWLALLGVELPESLLKEVLLTLHARVLPHLAQPLLLADSLTQALNHGGFTALLALHSIFLLVTRHGLEYPRFYERLYGLLQPTVFYVRHRRTFFELLGTFLASGKVPAYTVAAFLKRLLRQALTAPPPGAALAVALAHNLLRTHPSCAVLLHSPHSNTAAAGGGGGAGKQGDPYDHEAADPAAANALDSSLWELEALRQHAVPQVASALRLLDRDVTNRRATAEVDLGPWLGESLAGLVARELQRRVRQSPVLSQPPACQALFEAGCAHLRTGWAA